MLRLSIERIVNEILHPEVPPREAGYGGVGETVAYPVAAVKGLMMTASVLFWTNRQLMIFGDETGVNFYGTTMLLSKLRLREFTIQLRLLIILTYRRFLLVPLNRINGGLLSRHPCLVWSLVCLLFVSLMVQCLLIHKENPICSLIFLFRNSVTKNYPYP